MCFTTMEAELDKVTGRRDIIDERSYAQLSELQGNAKGVLFLLLSARASLLRHGADDECLRTMEECVASFRMQHDLTNENTNAGILWKETSRWRAASAARIRAWRGQREATGLALRRAARNLH
jgi:hypothetical protein